MIKKFIIAFVLALLLVGGFGLYAALQYRNNLRQDRQTAKAPQVSAKLLEGWSNKEIGDYLEKNGISSSADFLATEKNFDSSNYLFLNTKPEMADLQGFIFPDTYFITKPTGSGTTSDESLVKKALDNFEKKVTPQMQQQASANGLTLYQVITLASVIEKETGRNTASASAKQQLDLERQTVASIFYNRLKAGMALQSDATVLYALGKTSGSVSGNDLSVDSPYNTYQNKGLPPGPICNPSLSSIKAALNPDQSDYLYFLTIPQTGQAVFSKTYDEHLKNKQKYLQ